MLELKDAKGKTVVVPVQFEASGLRGKINLIKTAFGQNDRWFDIQPQNNSVLYINREKLKRRDPTSRSNSLRDLSASGASVLNEEELVKLKEQYPTPSRLLQTRIFQLFLMRWGTTIRNPSLIFPRLRESPYRWSRTEMFLLTGVCVGQCHFIERKKEGSTEHFRRGQFPWGSFRRAVFSTGTRAPGPIPIGVPTL